MKELESQHFAPSNEIMDLGKIIKTVKKYYMICRWRLYGGSSESSNRFQSTQHHRGNVAELNLNQAFGSS